jgi:hypothetical protein
MIRREPFMLPVAAASDGYRFTFSTFVRVWRATG